MHPADAQPWAPCLRQPQVFQRRQQRPQLLLHIQQQCLWDGLEHQRRAGNAPQPLLLQQEAVHRLRLGELHRRGGGAAAAQGRVPQALVDKADGHSLARQEVAGRGCQARAWRGQRPQQGHACSRTGHPLRLENRGHSERRQLWLGQNSGRWGLPSSSVACGEPRDEYQGAEGLKSASSGLGLAVERRAPVASWTSRRKPGRDHVRSKHRQQLPSTSSAAVLCFAPTALTASGITPQAFDRCALRLKGAGRQNSAHTRRPPTSHAQTLGRA